MKLNLALKPALALTFLAFVLSLCASMRETLISTGDTAPDFIITRDAGRPISPRNFGGKALLLNFWATWCEPCQTELPSLTALARLFASQGLVVLAVSQDADPVAYRRFTAQMSPILTVRQADKRLQLSYGTTHIPESYLIDSNGKVRGKYISNQNWTSPEVLEQVRALL
jgi:peroxiredoxin